MKNLAFSVLAAILFFSACKKDDKSTPASSSSFKLDNNTSVKTPYGFIQDFGGYNFNIGFATVDLVTNNSYNGKISLLTFNLATLTPGTYTYLSHDDTGYDSTKNFTYADCVYDSNMTEGSIDVNIGTYRNNPTNGTITLKKDGDTFTFIYEIQYGTSKVTGTYVGTPSYNKRY